MRAITIDHGSAHAGWQIQKNIAQTQHQSVGQRIALGRTHQPDDGDLLGLATKLNGNFFMRHNYSFT